MARIHLRGLGEPIPEVREFFDFFKGWAARSARHRLVERAEEAELILYVFGTDFRAAPSPEDRQLFAERIQDCFAFDAQDRPVGFLPGLYAAIPSEAFDSARFRTYCYPVENRYVETAFRARPERAWLYSFLGGASSPLRRKIYRLGGGRADVLIEDTTAHQEWNPHQPTWIARKERYADVLTRSEFCLCPRGAGVGSIRLFEAMQAGSVPVLISDRYVLPPGPRWDDFLIRVPEGAIGTDDLAGFLEPHRAGAREKGLLARRAWEEWFAPAVWLDRIVENVEALRAARRAPEARYRRLWPWWKMRREASEGTLNCLRTLRNRMRPR